MGLQMQVSIDVLRIIVDVFAIIVFTLGFGCPLIYTFIPYWKQNGIPSWVMISRLLVRFFLILLAVYNLLFPVIRLISPDWDRDPLRSLSIPLYIILTLLFLHMWWRHPDGIKGL
jgi:hypothetical protein